MNPDQSNHIQQQLSNAFAEKSPLKIVAGNSKAFYGNSVNAETLSLASHSGITEYHPSELVVTVRSGTLLSELEAELKKHKQMLAFEPPRHSDHTTIGGVVACGLSGPRRAACGSARDFVLGATIINGKAEKLQFGGQVMKNVAGYDASRLMVGAQGTLGVILDISLKTLPVSKAETSIVIRTELMNAIKSLRQWVKQGLPISASCYYQGSLQLRLSSTPGAAAQAINTIKQRYSTQEIDEDFWLQIKNQRHAFFTDAANNHKLWRCSHQSNTEFYGDDQQQLIEWNGALRWINSDAELHKTAAQHNGHATYYPLNSSAENLFQPLPDGLLKLHQQLKHAFDPYKLLNPARLYTDL